MIGVLSVGAGNIRSVTNAVDYLGFDYEVISEPARVMECTHVILPGVGSYHIASKSLAQNGWTTVIKQFHETKKPILGVCLGMQLLSTHGTEHGNSLGLGLIPGVVNEMPCPEGLKLPHLGWNEVKWQRDHPINQGIKKHMDFYFVHRFRFECEQTEHVLGSTEYGESFLSVVAHGNVVGVQFHPEKSQDVGMALLENFCEWDGQC